MTYLETLLQLHDTLLRQYVGPPRTASQILHIEDRQQEMMQKPEIAQTDPIRQLLQALQQEEPELAETGRRAEAASVPADWQGSAGFGSGAEQGASTWPDMETISRFFERDARRYGQ